MYKPQGTILGTLEAICRERIVLPAIQREFIWRPRQVCSLFDSLMQDYPIGPFLYWKVPRSNADKYPWYGFVQDWHEKNAPHNPDVTPRPNIPLTAVLDGQQRLTALNIGLRGSMAWKLPRTWWNIDANFPVRHLYLNILGEAPEDSESRYQFRFLREDRQLPRSELDMWFKVSEILDLQDTEVLRDWAREQKLPHDAFKRLNVLRKVIHDKPVIFAYEERSEEKVLHIFTRMNRGGTPLSYSDLLFSIIVEQVGQQRDMRKEILDFVDQLNAIGKGFDFKKDFVLKASLMLLNARIEFKASNFNELPFSEQWDKIKKVLTKTVRLINSFGLCKVNLVSENPLLAIAYYLYIKGTTISKSDRENIRLWLIRGMIKPRIWSSGANSLLTMFRRVIRENGMHGFPINEIENDMAKRDKSLEFNDEGLQELTEITIHDRAAFLLLSLLCDVDLAKNKYDLDHIFPHVKFTPETLRAAGVSDEKHEDYKDMRDRLPNLQLLEENENKRKQALLPKDWLIQKYPEPNSRRKYTHGHLLGDVPEGLDEFEAFYEARRKRLEEKIRQLLGYAKD